MCQDERERDIERNNRNEECCIANILKVIVTLQNRSDKLECFAEGCDRPFLGPTLTTFCFNTRPVELYRCCDGGLWEFPFTLNGTTGTSSVFRVENVEGCCCTVRVLAPNPDTATADTLPYVGTDSFVTLNLSCVGALRCLPDTFINCV